jgi:hypothetical protein
MSMADAKPYFGIPPFVLGMSRDAVRAAAGKPESIETTHDEERAIESWFYDTGAIELEFEDSPEARLESITAWSTEVTLNGATVVEVPLAELDGVAEQAGIPDLELSDDFGDSGQCYQSEALGLMVWAVKGKVVNFTIFPRFDEAGEAPQWPA